MSNTLGNIIRPQHFNLFACSYHLSQHIEKFRIKSLTKVNLIPLMDIFQLSAAYHMTCSVNYKSKNDKNY